MEKKMMKAIENFVMCVVCAVLMVLFVMCIVDRAEAKEFKVGMSITVPLNFKNIGERGTITIFGEAFDADICTIIDNSITTIDNSVDNSSVHRENNRTNNSINIDSHDRSTTISNTRVNTNINSNNKTHTNVNIHNRR